jgi:hypothetical protein
MVDLFELAAARLTGADRLAVAPLRGRAPFSGSGRHRRLGKDVENLPKILGAFATLPMMTAG